MYMIEKDNDDANIFCCHVCIYMYDILYRYTYMYIDEGINALLYVYILICMYVCNSYLTVCIQEIPVACNHVKCDRWAMNVFIYLILFE